MDQSKEKASTPDDPSTAALVKNEEDLWRPAEEKRNEEAGTFFRYFSPNPSPLPKVRKVNHAREETSQESASAEDRRQRSEWRGRP